MTDNAKNYHEKMFPGYVSDFLRTDPEFIEATQKNTTSSANVRKRLARAQSFLTS